jgi:thioredoxin-related protein
MKKLKLFLILFTFIQCSTSNDKDQTGDTNNSPNTDKVQFVKPHQQPIITEQKWLLLALGQDYEQA